MNNRLLVLITAGSALVILVCTINPIGSAIYRLMLLFGVLVLWISVTLLARHQRTIRFLLLSTPLLILTPLLLPGDRIDPIELRDTYVRRMTQFEGTRYFWGGENSLGIDCSGLPRRALRDALLACGVRRLDGSAFREFLEQWWFDASASALSKGYRHFTAPLKTTGRIESMDYSELLPGDLAVTRSGVHVLAYLGNNKWIQADPGSECVVIADGRMDKNFWFTVPVTTYRWSVLER